MTTNLTAFAEGLVMGTVIHGKGGRLTFLYSDEWLASPRAYPLSVSLPLAPGQQGHEKSNRSSGDYFPTMKLCSANGT